MAPPAKRRSGYSRKAQYGLFLSYVLAFAGIVVGALLLAASLLDRGGLGAARGAALDVTAPATSGSRGFVDALRGARRGIGAYLEAGSQNAALRSERDRLRRQLIAARAEALENRELKRLLAIDAPFEQRVASGRIVGSSFSSARRFAIFSAGWGDGVQVGLPVRAPDGLIGRVVDVGRGASRVLLIADRSNVVPVRLLRNGLPAISTGVGDGTIELKPLEVGQNPFKPGDIVITSGTGGIYPPNIAVASVIRLVDDGAIARPLADPASQSFAIALRAYEPSAAVDEGDEGPAPQ